ncbi:MAG: PaaI family thioesterase [Mycobacteriales bacterium]
MTHGVLEGSAPTGPALNLDDLEAQYRADWDQRLREGRAPLHKMLGLQIKQLRPSVILTMELSHAVEGFYAGSVHGGILATFADVASAVSLWNSHERGKEIPVTIDMNIRYYRQPKGGPLSAAAQVVHEGKRLLSNECVVTDAQDRVLIRTSATYTVQPIRW